jgi:hypothetical protein
MKVAVIVPTFTMDEDLGKMAADNAKIWKTQCDDLIITEDDGGYYRDLARAADLYMLHRNLGVAANMNLAWKVALVRGADYVAIADSDVTWKEGSLKNLCIPGKIGVPVIDKVGPRAIGTSIIAPMLVVPKEVAAERGIYNDGGGFRMEGFDYEYYHVVKDLIVQVESCIISHIGSATRAIYAGAFPWLTNDPAVNERRIR